MAKILLVHRESGTPDATPVVLLHGLTSTMATWDAVSIELADRARLIVLDLRGHGTSPWPGEYGFELMRDDLLYTLGELALLDGDRRPVLVGHSMGGRVAHLAAAARPDAFAGLVVEDSPPPRPQFRDAGPRPDEPLAYDWAAKVDIFAEITAPDPRWWAELSTVTCPVLVVGGARSHIPQDMLAEMAGEFPAGRYVALDADHQVHKTRPVEFAAAVRAFLDELDR